MSEISKVEKNSTYLKILWNDGEESKFNYLWLRDNCPTAHDKNSNHRMFNILNVSKNINAKNYNINKNGKLEIEWSEGDHKSIYDTKWLRENCYTIKNKKKYISPYELWDSSLQNNIKSISIDHDEIISSDEGLIRWLELLHHKGIAIVKNSPIEKESAFPILNRISHTRETFFKTPFEVIDIPNPNNSAYTAAALRNHLDLPYYEIAPGYQFLHCLINNATGGESVAVDGFKVASYMKENFTEFFETLLETPVKFVNRDYTSNAIRVMHKPLFSLDHNNDFNDIRFSVAYMGVMDCDPDQMDKFYEAYRKLIALLHDPKFEINFKLKAGDIFSFNNRRVLHGRKEYDANSGERHLQGYYIDRDEIIGRLNFLNKINP